MQQGSMPMFLLVDDDAEHNVAMVTVRARAGYGVDRAAEEAATPAGIFPALRVAVTESHYDRATTHTSPAYGGTYHLWGAPQVKHDVKRHYEWEPYWIGFAFRDLALTKIETT